MQQHGKGKVKVKLSLRLIKQAWAWRYSSAYSLTSALDGGEWSALPPSPGARWIGGWVRTGLDAVSKGKIPSSRLEWNPDHPITSP
jgi:hypothetical protein